MNSTEKIKLKIGDVVKIKPFIEIQSCGRTLDNGDIILENGMRFNEFMRDFCDQSYEIWYVLKNQECGVVYRLKCPDEAEVLDNIVSDWWFTEEMFQANGDYGLSKMITHRTFDESLL